MSSNGVIRIGRKGVKKFAFGEDGPVFEVDVVAAFQRWIAVDEEYRTENDGRRIATGSMPAYHQAAVGFVAAVGGGVVTIAEALDFIARLQEQFNELADFFQPKSREKPESPVSSGQELRFSVEEEPFQSSTS